MNTEYKIHKILFIRGVFFKDCIPSDSIFEQQIMDKLNIEQHVISYTQIPSTFHSMDTWIKKTNVKCWYCDLNFSNTPVFIPRNMDQISKSEYNISTLGCFCSFSCAVSFNNIVNQKICDNVNVRDMLLYLYKIFTGKSVYYIQPSPNKYIMKQYGGDVDDIDYRGKINEIKEKMDEH